MQMPSAPGTLGWFRVQGSCRGRGLGFGLLGFRVKGAVRLLQSGEAVRHHCTVSASVPGICIDQRLKRVSGLLGFKDRGLYAVLHRSALSPGIHGQQWM